jgi:hypothetical protein
LFDRGLAASSHCQCNDPSDHGPAEEDVDDGNRPLVRNIASCCDYGRQKVKAEDYGKRDQATAAGVGKDHGRILIVLASRFNRAGECTRCDYTSSRVRRILVMELGGTPQVERWPSDPSRFVVTYGFTGGWWTPEGETELKRQMNDLGVDEVLLRPDKIMLYGVRKGSESAVHEVLTTAIASEEERRASAEEEYERSRPQREAEEARHEQELDEVRDAFRRASGGDTTD